MKSNQGTSDFDQSMNFQTQYMPMQTGNMNQPVIVPAGSMFVSSVDSADARAVSHEATVMLAVHILELVFCPCHILSIIGIILSVLVMVDPLSNSSSSLRTCSRAIAIIAGCLGFVFIIFIFMTLCITMVFMLIGVIIPMVLVGAGAGAAAAGAN